MTQQYQTTNREQIGLHRSLIHKAVGYFNQHQLQSCFIVDALDIKRLALNMVSTSYYIFSDLVTVQKKKTPI